MKNEATCVCSTPYTMTMAEWKAKHADYKATEREGGKLVRYALRLCSTHGTTRAPVTIVKAAAAPKPVKTESRICFGIAWYATEADAKAADAAVRERGETYNGGFFHGMPCGRDTSFDYVDPEHGPLYAVTGR